jgi:hypothetical protein
LQGIKEIWSESEIQDKSIPSVIGKIIVQAWGGNVIKCKESGKNQSGYKNLPVRFIQCNSKLEITKFDEETVDAIRGICNKNEGWIIDVVSQERCVYNRLIGHIENMISVAQHGFLRGKSCTGQLISVLHRISQNLDSGKQTDILYFDVAKAFDTVNHNLLLKKLQRFGLKDNILTWFKNYLSGRQHRVLVNGEISETRPVSSGVPQGSIVGPLLFLIYINDLPESITSPAVDVSLFADDTKCISVVESPVDACVLQAEARNVEKWAEFWRLKFNAEKCKVLSITRKRHPLVAEYIVNGKTLQHVSS